MASIKGTKEFFQKKLNIKIKKNILRNGWKTSSIGYGGYRVSLQNQYSLQYAIQSGINFIDTSPKYENGDSERMIGNVIQGLEKEGIIKREEMIISSKIGFHKEGNEEWKQKFNDLELLNESIELSLKRLKMKEIDILYLHNPKEDENFKEIFQFLDEKMKDKKIQTYGITFQKFDKNKLIELIELYPNLKFIQFPFNLNEYEYYFHLLNYKNRINLIGHRPFYTFKNQLQFMIESSIHSKKDFSIKELQDQFNLLLNYESNLNLFHFTKKILANFDEITHSSILYTLQNDFDLELKNFLLNHNDMNLEIKKYQLLLNDLYQLFSDYLNSKNYHEMILLKNNLKRLNPKLKGNLQSIILSILSNSNIDVILNGMRSPSYVEDLYDIEEELNNFDLNKYLIKFYLKLLIQ